MLRRKLKHTCTPENKHVLKDCLYSGRMDIADRIKQAREAAGMDRYGLAKACNISYQAVQQWETGRTKPSAKTLLKIARATNSNPAWLIEGSHQKPQSGIQESDQIYSANTQPTDTIISKVPLISSVHAGNWCEAADNFYPGDAEEWIPCPTRHSRHAYALRVKGISMEPKFREGEIIIVDPEIAASQYVVAKKLGSNEVTLKQLVVESGESYLKAVNPQWQEPIIKITEEWMICGTVICKIELF